VRKCPFGVPFRVQWCRITDWRSKECKALITVEILAGGNETGYKEKRNMKTSKEHSSTIDDKCVATISAVEAERVMLSTSSVRLPATPTLCFRSLPRWSGMIVTKLCSVPASANAIGRHYTAALADNTDFM